MMDEKEIEQFLLGTCPSVWEFCQRCLMPTWGKGVRKLPPKDWVKRQPERAQRFGLISLVCEAGFEDSTGVKLYVCNALLRTELDIARSKTELRSFVESIVGGKGFDDCVLLLLHSEEADNEVDKEGKHVGDWRLSWLTRNDEGHLQALTFILGPQRQCRTTAQDFCNWNSYNRNDEIRYVRDIFGTVKLESDFYNDLEEWYLWVRNEKDTSRVFFPHYQPQVKGQRDLGDLAHYEGDEDVVDDTGERVSAGQLRRRDNVKRLIVRLLFVWFYKQKGCVADDFFNYYKVRNMLGNVDLYATSTSKSANGEPTVGGEYYNAILQNLFFATLNMPSDEREVRSKVPQNANGYAGQQFDAKYLRFQDWFTAENRDLVKLFSPVPYLNGGLFECLDPDAESARTGGDTKEYRDGFTNNHSHRAALANCYFFGEPKQWPKRRRGLLEIFRSYNFTVEESAPMETVVSLVPDLMGNVYEQLLAVDKGQKADGTYYTPNEVVEYITSEALARELRQHLAATRPNAPALEQLYPLFEKGLLPATDSAAAFSQATLEAIDAHLRDLRVLDPACGSGAFTCGAMHMLFMARKAINNALGRNTDSAKGDFELLSQIVQSNIFGIDISGIALMLSKLRFFVALLCHEPKYDPTNPDNFGQEILPNIETHFVWANALLSPKLRTWDLTTAAKYLEDGIAELSSIRGQYFNEHKREAKRDLRDRDQAKCDEIGQQARQRLEERCCLIEAEIARIERALEEVRSKATMTDYTQETRNLFDQDSPDTRGRRLSKAKTIEQLEKGLRTRRQVLAKMRDDINAAVNQFVGWQPYRSEQAADWFDPKFMFGLSVGNDRGEAAFDVVLGNPPYVSLNKHKRLSALYEKGPFQTQDRLADGVKYSTMRKDGDLYCLFLERAAWLLRDNGVCGMITSIKWMRTTYGNNLKEMLLSETSLDLIIDLTGISVFKAAVDCDVLMFSKPTQRTTSLYLNKPLGESKTLVNLRQQLSNVTASVKVLSAKDNWDNEEGSDKSALKAKVESLGTPLCKSGIAINYGIKTGKNEAFIVTDEQREAILAQCADADEKERTEALIKRILRGRDIKPYSCKWANLWLIATFPAMHYDINHFPAVVNYLLSYGKERLEQTGKQYTDKDGKPYKARKKSTNKWFELQDNVNYWSEFLKPKIVYPNMTKFMPFYYDTEGFFSNDKSFIITGEGLCFLTAFFNSSLFKYCFRENFPKLHEDTRELRKVFFDKIPVHLPTPDEEAHFAKLVADIQADYSTDKAKAIDQAIFDLYGLADEERKAVGFIEL